MNLVEFSQKTDGTAKINAATIRFHERFGKLKHRARKTDRRRSLQYVLTL